MTIERITQKEWLWTETDRKNVSEENVQESECDLFQCITLPICKLLDHKYVQNVFIGEKKKSVFEQTPNEINLFFSFFTFFTFDLPDHPIGNSYLKTAM